MPLLFFFHNNPVFPRPSSYLSNPITLNTNSNQNPLNPHNSNGGGLNGLNGASSFPVEVDVLGTEERNTASFNKYTIYIVEVKIAEVAIKIFVRYSQMVDFQNIIKTDFPNIQLSSLSRVNWLSSHKTKTIEQRKLIISQILNRVLSHQQFAQSPKRGTLLDFLGLPTNLYELPQQVMMYENCTSFSEFGNQGCINNNAYSKGGANLLQQQ